MNVAGLNNLGFQAAAGKSGAKAAGITKEKSSFEKILGQSQSRSSRDDQPETAESSEQDRNVSQERPSFPVQQQPLQRQQQSDKAQSDSNTESIPTGGMPNLSGPTLTDRLPMASPMNPNVANVMVNPPPTASVQEDTANSLTRRVVWNDFLRKMNDLGVSAEDVLQAFGSLNDKDLALPPEQTVDKVVMALGLDGQQAALAKQYFTELISKTKSKSFGEELASSNKQMSLTLMTQRELQRRNLQKSLDVMDRNFFMPKPLSREARAEMMAQSQTQVARQEIENPQSLAEDSNEESLSRTASLLRAPVGAPTAMTATATPQNPGAASDSAPRAMNDMLAQMQAPAPEDNKSIDQMIQKFTRQNNKASSAELAMTTAPAMPAVTNSAAAVTSPVNGLSPAASNALNAILGSAAGRGDDSTSSDDARGEDATQDLSQLNSALTAENRLGDAGNVKGDFQSQMAKAGTAQPQVMGVPDFVEQAHVMVRDGGGEMKVTLHPDGLGDVAMHVRVNEGKVSVQMITESDEAKKLIERQIGDLKSGLSQNHLQVDSIKVDTATNLGKQLEQQYQDAQRQQTHLAWEQFRQDSQGWRRSFFDNGVVKPYRSQGDAPRDVQAPHASSVKAKSRNGGNRRLDLVA